MLSFGRKDALTDLVQALQKPSNQDPQIPPGHVVTSDGSVVLLDRKPVKVSSFSSTQKASNSEE